MVFRWDDFELDSDGFTLTRAGEPIAVEPRVLDLLVWLVRRPGALVTKEELNREVWDGQIVGDAALSRCVYEARRALGDDAKRQRYIATVHGRGFRFVGELEPEVDVKRPDSVDRASGPPAEVREPRAVAWWSRSLVRWSLAALVLATLVVGFAQQRSDPAWHRKSGEAIRAGLLAAVPEGDGLVPLTAQAVAEYLGDRLASAPRLVWVDPGRVETVVLESASLEEAVEALRLDALVEVRMAALAGDRLAAETVLYWRREREFDRAPLLRFELDLPSTNERLDRFNRQRAEVAEQLAGALEIDRLPPFSEARNAASVEAFQRARQAWHALEENFCSEAALVWAREATELEPDYADGWSFYAAALNGAAWSCGRDQALLDEAVTAARRALALAPELEPRYRMFEIDMMIESGRVEEGYAAYLELESKGWPTILESSAGYALRYMGFLELAEERMRNDLERNPLLYLDYSGMVPNELLYQERYSEFLDLLPAGTSSYHRFYRGWALYLDGRLEEAVEVLRPAFRERPDDLWGRYSQALLELVEGREEAAAAVLVQLERQREEVGHGDGEVSYKQAQLFAAAGDERAALRNLERTIDAGFVCTPCFEGDPTLRSVLATEKARTLLERAEIRRAAFARRFGLRI